MSSNTPETAEPKIGLHQAVAAAERFLTGLYSRSRIKNVLLEEVEENPNEWLITFGFDIPRSPSEPIAGIFLPSPMGEEVTRVFKRFVVDAASGKVRAMKIHPNAASA